MIQTPGNRRNAAAAGLVVERVRHGYAEGGVRREILQGASLEIHPGECVALLGRSGSGKTTLLNLIAGTDTPDSGRISLGGRDLTQLGERERTLVRRRDIGFIHQAFNLLPELTAEENVRLPLDLNRLPPANARSMLEAVGLASRARTLPDRLSGGEQQRIAIARALVHEPLLMLADEPTGSLDAETGERVLALLLGLVRSRGGMLLLVTHAAEVAAEADRVVLLAGGRLSAGPGEERR